MLSLASRAAARSRVVLVVAIPLLLSWTPKSPTVPARAVEVAGNGDPAPVTTRHYLSNDPTRWVESVASRGAMIQVGSATASNPSAQSELLFSTFFGGSALENAGLGDLVVLDDGSFILVAETRSNDLPGAPNGLAGDGRAEFIAKFAPSGNLDWISTYGGSSTEATRAAGVDNSGNIYVVGSTVSDDFPLVNPFQSENEGEGDAFIMKFGPDGSLLWSTLLGGKHNDRAMGVDFNADGRPIVVGATASDPSEGDDSKEGTFPTSGPGVVGGGGGGEIFVVDFNPDGSGFALSYFIGGVATEEPTDFEITSGGDYVILGEVNGDIPTVDAFQAAYGGGSSDLFLMKTRPNGGEFVFSTFLGGSGGDTPNGLVITTAGHIIVAGNTTSQDHPIKDPLVESVSTPAAGTLSEFGPDGSIVFTGYAPFSPTAIAPGLGEEVLITGTGNSGNVPIVDPIPDGDTGSGAYASRFDAATKTITFSSIYPSGVTQGHQIAGDADGVIILVGTSLVGDVPLVNPIQDTRGGGWDLFIARIGTGGGGGGGGGTDPAIRVIPSEVLFPLILPGAMATEPVVIESVGGDSLIIEAIEVEPEGLFELSNAPQIPFMLDAGEDVTFEVTYTPTAAAAHPSGKAARVADQLGKLTIINNSDTPEVEVPLTTGGFVVNTADDGFDADPTDNACDASLTTQGAQCTLRAALEIINAAGSSEQTPIVFALPGDGPHEINVSLALPPIQYPVLIDGSTQPGTGRIKIVPNSEADNGIGLDLQAGGSIVRSVDLTFFETGINMAGSSKSTVDDCGFEEMFRAIKVETDGHEILNSRVLGGTIGFDVAGDDVLVDGNTIQVTEPFQYYSRDGIFLTGSRALVFDNTIRANGRGIAVKEGSDHRLEGNTIGRFIDGDPSSHQGITIKDARSVKVVDNTIAGYNLDGIKVEGGGDHTVSENRIGTEGIGRTVDLNGLSSGIYVNDSNSNLLYRNVVGDNKGEGISVRGGAGNTVQENVVGISKDGTSTIPNEEGIRLWNGPRKTVILSNTVSANTVGILVSSGHETTISNNLVGLSPSGDAAMGNLRAGIEIRYATNSTIDDNTISGNGVGILVQDGTVARPNFFRSNKIGTDSKGLFPIPNEIGILINAEGAWMEGNVISGNTRFGIEVITERKGAFERNHTTILSNIIGLNADKLDPNHNMGNPIGIQFLNSAAADVTGNQIASNRGQGIVFNETLGGFVVTENVITGHEVGVQLLRTIQIEIGCNIFNNNALHIDGNGDVGTEIECNDFSESTGTSSAVHLTNSAATLVRGNLFTKDAGDAIFVEEGEAIRVVDNSITEIAGLAVNNVTPSMSVDATSNWWGAADGPSGSGPGSGQAVSDGVDFEDWLVEPPDVVITTPVDTAELATGAADTIRVYVQNWADRGDAVEMSVFDTQGWLTSVNAFDVQLTDSMAAAVDLEFELPESVADGEESTVTIMATSRSNGEHVSEAALLLRARTSSIVAIAVLPDSVEVVIGDTVAFAAVGVDQFGREVETMFNWSASGGVIDQAGVFVAGSEAGTFAVQASAGSGSPTGTATVRIVLSAVSVEDAGSLPEEFVLHPNYPNPFNPTTTIRFDLPITTHVRLYVFDVLGRQVALLVDGVQAEGSHTVLWNALSPTAGQLPSGMYLYRIETRDFVSTRTMMLIR